MEASDGSSDRVRLGLARGPAVGRRLLRGLRVSAGERQEREEAQALLRSLADQVIGETGLPPEFIIQQADSTRAALKAVVAADPDIKVLILATSTAGRGPGPLISAIAKEGVGFSGRKLPVTVVPGDLTDAEIEALA